MTRDLSASQVALIMHFPFYLILSQFPLDLPLSLPLNPSCVTAWRTTPGITEDGHKSVGEWKKLAVGLQTGNSHHFSPFFLSLFPDFFMCISLPLLPPSHPTSCFSFLFYEQFWEKKKESESIIAPTKWIYF